MAAVMNVLGVQFLRASGFNGPGPDNLLGLQVVSDRLSVGATRNMGGGRFLRATLGGAADIAIVASDKQSPHMSGDAEGYARLAMILIERNREIELYAQATISEFFIGFHPENPDFVLDVLFGVEARL
jgi:hypothetical protein